MKATVVPDSDALRRDQIPGSIEIRIRDGQIWGVAFICPCGCGNESYLPAKDTGHSSGWTFAGTFDQLTALPSVHNTGMPCRWHGWLRNGEWVPA